MTNINIAYLAQPSRGGWPTYTAHLVHGLQSAGHTVALWKLGKRTETHDRPFGRGLRYRNASAEFLTELSRMERLHISACEPSTGKTTLSLLRAGATVTAHDPTELKNGMQEVFRESKEPVVVIRSTMAGHFRGHDIPYRYVRHPYFRMRSEVETKRTRHAVAFSRLDWDKGTHHIVSANLNLTEERAVHLYGAENRLYTHHKLVSIDPNWRSRYHGPWPVDDLWGGVRIAQKAHVSVDMSSIKGDGGGTQYTFLEALDAGTSLILNKAWCNVAANEMVPYASFAEDDKELTALLNGSLVQHEPASLFDRHDARLRSLETVGIA